MLTPWKKSYDQLRQHIKKQRHCFANKGPSSQSYGFSSSHVWMWELNYKESWVLKNWCFWTVVLEKTLESPLDCKEIKPVNPKGNQPWIFLGGTDAEAPILCHMMRKADSLEKTLMLGEIEGGRRRGRQRMRWLDGITSSVIPFSSCPQSLPASESFPKSQFFAWGGQSIGVSASTLVLPMNTQDWSPLGWTGWISLQSKGLSRVFSNATVQKHQFFSAQLSS